jgi:hypothetical protein
VALARLSRFTQAYQNVSIAAELDPFDPRFQMLINWLKEQMMAPPKSDEHLQPN